MRLKKKNKKISGTAKRHTDTKSHNIKIHIGAIEFFDLSKIHTLDDLKGEYWRLAKQYHPDITGGSKEKFQSMQNEYDNLTDSFLRNSNFTASEVKNEVELDETYKAVINAIVGLEGLKIEIVGKWIWVSGNTFPVKDILKSTSFKFAPVKKMWYYTFGERSKSRKEFTIDQIRNRYGSKDITTKRAKLSGVVTKSHAMLKKGLNKLKKLMDKRAKYINATNTRLKK